MSRRLSFFYDILLEFGEPVSGHAFALRCVPPSFPGQEILDVTLDLDPQVPYTRQRDSFGNPLPDWLRRGPSHPFSLYCSGILPQLT